MLSTLLYCYVQHTNEIHEARSLAYVLTQNNLLVFSLASDHSLRSTKLSLESARECARNGWLVRVGSGHDCQHAAESSNKRALDWVNDSFPPAK